MICELFDHSPVYRNGGDEFVVYLSGRDYEARHDKLRALQDSADMTALMVIQEEMKTAPFGDVWDEYLRRENVPADYLSAVQDYEKKVLVNRV